MRRSLVVPAALGLALGLTGCGAVPLADAGTPTTQTREVAGVRSVTLASAGTLRIAIGGSPSLTVTAGERLLARVTSEVRDGVLVLDVEPGSGLRDARIEYDLVVTDLVGLTVQGSGSAQAQAATGDAFAVSVEGSGDVSVADVDVRDLTVAVAGSGDVDLRGSADSQRVQLDGSGSYRGDALRSETAVVSLQGSGDAHVRATRRLDVDLDGSGSVTHTGGATVAADVSGSGDVRAA